MALDPSTRAIQVGAEIRCLESLLADKTINPGRAAQHRSRLRLLKSEMALLATIGYESSAAAEAQQAADVAADLGVEIDESEFKDVFGTAPPPPRSREGREVPLSAPAQERISFAQDSVRKNWDGTVFSADTARADFVYFCKYCLPILYRDGMSDTREYDPSGRARNGPFILSSHQRSLIRAVLTTMLVDKQPGRFQLLKTRQLGSTTLWLALALWFQLKWAPFNFMLIIDKHAHLTDKRDLYLGWVDHLEKNFPELGMFLEAGGRMSAIIKVGVRGGKDKKPNFCHAMWDTGGSKNPGTSHQLHYVVYSEMPKWDEGSPAVVERSVSPAVQTRWDTLIVNESTAKGVEYFYHHYVLSVNGQKPLTKALFLPWFISAEYTQPAAAAGFVYQDWDPRFNDWDPENPEVELRESEMAVRYKLSPEQVTWRRTKIMESGGQRVLFDQEYPTTWQHAFRATSYTYLGSSVISWLSACNEEVRVHRILDARGKVDATQPIYYSQLSPVLAPASAQHGSLFVREMPEPKKRYFAGVDVCEGISFVNEQSEDDPDYNSCTIVDEDGRWVAIYLSRSKPDETWLEIVLLCLWYNQATLNGELNGPGLALLSRVKQSGYPAMFFNPKARKSGPIEDSYWTRVTKGNREALFSQWRMALMANTQRAFSWSAGLHAETPLRQLGGLVRNVTSGKVAGSSGVHDDICFSGIHAEWCRVIWLGLLTSSAEVDEQEAPALPDDAADLFLLDRLGGPTGHAPGHVIEMDGNAFRRAFYGSGEDDYNGY